MKIDVVTTEEIVYSGDVDIVIAPGSDGQLGILPRHAALLTSIEAGIVLVGIPQGRQRYQLVMVLWK